MALLLSLPLPEVVDMRCGPWPGLEVTCFELASRQAVAAAGSASSARPRRFRGGPNPLTASLITLALSR